ncbi:MAG: FAD-binding oxidoreductase [Chloroflexota bacterium]
MGRIGRRRFLQAMAAAAAGVTVAGRIPGARGAEPIAVPPGAAGALGRLAGAMQGDLLLPGDADWTALNTTSNARWLPVVPLAIARCADAADVQAALAWARAEGVPFAIRGGGHHYMGGSTSPGLVISTIAMKGTRYDPETGLLIAGAGVQNQDLAVVQSQDGAGRFILPGGTCPTVGLGGLTLGGGIGPNARWAGLTADHLIATEIVTADGELLTVDAERHPDLFWALRGGAGGSFGVNTSFTYRLAPIPGPEALVFGLETSSRDRVLQTILTALDALADAPHGFSVILMAYSDAEHGVAMEGYGQITDPDDPEQLARVDAILGLDHDETARLRLPFWEAQAWNMGGVTPPNAYWDRARFATGAVDPAAIAEAVDALTRFPGLTDERYGELVTYGWVGGAVGAVARDATAWVHRDATALFRVSAVWPRTPEVPGEVSPIPADAAAWSEATWDALIPALANESYQNFPDPGLIDWATAYHAENLPRLRAVKGRYDPEDVFRAAQSVPLP